MADYIEFKKGYKYQLANDYTHELVHFGKDDQGATGFVSINNGHLTLKRGYAWDGPSGPTFDTKNFMRGSLVHDGLYELMRNGVLDPAIHREPADKELHSACRADGMSRFRAWYVLRAVRRGAKASSLPSHYRKVFRAP